MSAIGMAAYGMYPRNVVLPEVVYALNRAGFQNEDICMVLSPAHPVATTMRDANIVDVDGEQSATSARMIRWFSELGAVVIPTIGLFIRSQEFFTALLVEENLPACLEDRGPLWVLASRRMRQEDWATSYAMWGRWCTSHVRKVPKQIRPSNCCGAREPEKLRPSK